MNQDSSSVGVCCYPGIFTSSPGVLLQMVPSTQRKQPNGLNSLKLLSRTTL